MDNFDDINFAAGNFENSENSEIYDNSENTGQTGFNFESGSPTENKKGWFDEIPQTTTAENLNPPQSPPHQTQHQQNFNQPYWNQTAAQNGFNNPGGYQPGSYQPGSYQPGGYQGGFSQPGPFPNAGYNQGAFYRPVPVSPPAVSQRRDTGLSIASFVLSILSIVLIWVPALNLILALTALILGIVSLVKGCGGFGIAGVVISSVALFASIIYSLLFLSLWSLRISKPSLEYDFDIEWMMAILPSIFK